MQLEIVLKEMISLCQMRFDEERQFYCRVQKRLQLSVLIIGAQNPSNQFQHRVPSEKRQSFATKANSSQLSGKRELKSFFFGSNYEAL